MAGRYALIVANDRYDDPKLKQLRAPVKDAEALARVLGNPTIGDFDVSLVMNEPQHLLRRTVNRFFNDRKRDDTLLLHFSCHGLKDESGQLFFATTDTEVAHLDDSALESEWVRRRIDASRSMKIVVLLDCCYSGAFTGDMLPRAGDAVHAIEPLGGTGRVVITASSALEYSWEGDTRSGEPSPSVFTSALVRGLETGEADRDHDQWISIGELYDYVFDAIADSGAKQHPQMKSDVQGELLVARSRHVRRQPLPPELEILLDSPVTSARAALVADLADLLRKGGGLALTAREELERLRDSDDSMRVRSLAAAALEGAEVEDEPGATARLPHDAAVMAIAFSADGQRLATACRDNTARLWDIASGREHRCFVHDDWVIAVAPSADGRLLASACRDHAARIWDVESGGERGRLTHDGVVWAVAFSPDGRLLASAGADATVRLWDISEGRERDCLRHDGAVVAVRFSPDGRQIATASQRGTARVWDLGSGREEARLTAGDAMLAVAFDRGHRVLAAGAGPDALRLWDVTAGVERVRLEHDRVRAAAIGSNGLRVATAGDDGTARLWDAGDGRELARLPDAGRIRAIALTPDDRRLAVAGSDTVQVWRPGR
jgi:caspase domain-containing protein/WD40 domain-containing protein